MKTYNVRTTQFVGHISADKINHDNSFVTFSDKHDRVIAMFPSHTVNSVMEMTPKE